MSFDITVTQEARCTRVAVRGCISIGKLHSLLEVLQIECAAWPPGGLLFDLRTLEGSFSEQERAVLKVEAVRRLGRARDVRFEWG